MPQRNSNTSFDDLKFSYTQVQGSDICNRLRARRLYLPRKGTCGEEGRVQQQPCPEYSLLVQLCVIMEKNVYYILVIYWLSRWVRVKQPLQSALAVDEECQGR